MSLEMELELGPLRAVVLPERGGRVENLFYRGHALMTNQSVHPENWGSTFWPSPQSTWGWPPIMALDSGDYQVLRATEQEVQLLSPEVKLRELPFQITKQFCCEPWNDKSVFQANYSMRALRSGSLSLACWEITRVAGGGISFFETGQMQLTPIAPHSDLVGDRVDGFTFYDHNKLHTGVARKVHAHTKGRFLAHLHLAPEPLLILKLFEPLTVAQQAPGEGIIELFYNACGGYIELEIQGAYQELELAKGPELTIHTLALRPPSSMNLSDLSALGNWTKSIASQFHEGGLQ